MKWRVCNINEISQDERRDCYLEMSQSRKARADRYKNSADVMRSVSAEWLLKSLLSDEFGIEKPVIAAHRSGKPYVIGHDIFVSISHSGDLVAVCADYSPVGIDIEMIRPTHPSLADRICTDAEREYVKDDITRLFEIWTGKEAYYKMSEGDSFSFKSVNVLELNRHTQIIDGAFLQIVCKC